jgi:hypothetical protein
MAILNHPDPINPSGRLPGSGAVRIALLVKTEEGIAVCVC